MSFERQETDKWKIEVPGARWFKADLHVHTIDDYAGGKAKMPEGLSGDPKDPEVLKQYARLFLQALVEKKVQVIGLTPHSPRIDEHSETSAVWRIVEEWNFGLDDDNVPFRDKIYAVFPGFEPSLNTGRAGLHILFLFDPEIGRERYLKVFDLAMGSVSPWKNRELQMSQKGAEEVFDDLRGFWRRGSPTEWDYLVLAPHIDGEKGLLRALKAQPLQLFKQGGIAGLELQDNQTPEKAWDAHPKLRKEMEKRHQAFFHASDANRIGDLGKRYTWVKLASPRIEALRQAFIASDSRMRIGFEKDADGNLCEIDNSPDITTNKRPWPWLKEVTVRGGASFFGGLKNGKQNETIFRLSPDLTCIIGGNMTGKSAFLDGLRTYIDASLPKDDSVRKQVEERGSYKFAAGSPDIKLVCPGQDPTAPLNEQWPAQFFAQNELQRLSQESATIESILARLIPSEMENIATRGTELQRLDGILSNTVKEIARLDETVSEAEQNCQRTQQAEQALTDFLEAGVDQLHQASRRRQLWESAAGEIRDALRQPLKEAVRAIGDAKLPELVGDEVDWENLDLSGRQREIAKDLETITQEVEEWISRVSEVFSTMTKLENDTRVSVEQALAKRGYDAGKLREIQELNRQASLVPHYKALFEDKHHKLNEAETAFRDLLEKRRNLVKDQRLAFDRVLDGVEREFKDRIRARRENEADSRPLEKFLLDMRKKGITQWWHSRVGQNEILSPCKLAECFDSGKLAEVNMTETVQETFRENITKIKRYELDALRCPDRYVIEARTDGDSYLPLEHLSGGKRISVLLSLLLETSDERPLVIDQPEDELDNQFLFNIILPALKKLRGKRQVIIATHNANIVVNGDADMVIQLDATARQGRVACAGAIEEPAVRDAIVRTVDGGTESFRLRKRKYGF